MEPWIGYTERGRNICFVHRIFVCSPHGVQIGSFRAWVLPVISGQDMSRSAPSRPTSASSEYAGVSSVESVISLTLSHCQLKSAQALIEIKSDALRALQCDSTVKDQDIDSPGYAIMHVIVQDAAGLNLTCAAIIGTSKEVSNIQMRRTDPPPPWCVTNKCSMGLCCAQDDALTHHCGGCYGKAICDKFSQQCLSIGTSAWPVNAQSTV